MIVTRFAPSPTGYLHIGGARTALFNWLYARHHGGRFHLRIEDTDRARSTQGAIDAIIEGLRWLGLDWDGDIVYQFARAHRHAEIAHALLAAGHAYYCYCTAEELAAMRDEAKEKGLPPRYDRRWRDRSSQDAPSHIPPVIRLKAPIEGDTVIYDLVQGEVRIQNEQLDDMVLLRADGTPTYMLSVVVDDHDMGITHVIRGDDHLTNSFRQYQIYRAMEWAIPQFAHLPLIHGPDGTKLSKRHGALGVEAYRDMGYLPEALRNYLLRLGWSHGDEEIIPTEKAIAWFDINHIGQSPARLDFARLDSLNGHYLRETDDSLLVGTLMERLPRLIGHSLTGEDRARLAKAMPGLKPRAKTLVELAQNALFYVMRSPLPIDEKAQKLLTEDARKLLKDFENKTKTLTDWSAAAIEAAARSFAEARGLKLSAIAQPLRAALTGSTVSPPIFEVCEVLGQTETLARLELDAAG